jgi:hypothetical protein
VAVKGKQLAHELWTFKNGNQPDVRQRLEIQLAALLWRWLGSHEICLTGETDCDSFEVVTTVPSASGRQAHPLERMASTTIGATAERYRRLLEVNPSVSQERVFNVDRWQSQRLAGESVLLLDDTWTTGAHAQSASAALRQSGAGTVAVLCIGRHYNPNQPGEFGEAAREHLRRSQRLGWDWDFCCFETRRD